MAVGPPATTKDRFARFRRTGQRALRNELVEEHRDLADIIARRYRNRGVEMDDLRQTALLGLVKAVERFDPDHGTPFSAFAGATIHGELKRYFRDHSWAVRPPRGVQEAHLRVRACSEELNHQLGRPPTVSELAQSLDISPDRVIEALAASAAYRPAPLEPRSEDPASNETFPHLAVKDHGFDQSEVRIMIDRLLTTLPLRDATILKLRFFDGLTQSDIGERVGVSQMHVSRLIRNSLSTLRSRIEPQFELQD